jgi:arginyl-tRNA--protein-N-Asp/Glu arginylyltransferase
MKLLFSETNPDYARYQYPYVVWGVPEPGETPADLFAAGFMPASPQLDRFTLARHLRVPLNGFKPDTENRRVLRKGAGIEAQLFSRGDFEYSADRRERWLTFAEDRFGESVMPAARLDALMSSPAITHLLHFTDAATRQELGTVLMYLELPRMAFYYYAFYDLTDRSRSLGIFMMTHSMVRFTELGCGHLYLGTCYSQRACYKRQFAGIECFNGLGWTSDVAELDHLLARDPHGPHRLNEPGHLERNGGTAGLAQQSGFRATFGNGELPAARC